MEDTAEVVIATSSQEMASGSIDLDDDRIEKTRYIEECYRVIQQNSSVEDILVIDKFGDPVKSTMDAKISVEYGGVIDQLMTKTLAAVKVIDGTCVDEIRLKTKKNEIYIFSDQYELTFVVHQAPVEDEPCLMKHNM